MKIRISHLIVVLLYISLFRNYWFPDSFNQFLKIMTLVLVGVYIFPKTRKKTLINECLFVSFLFVLSSIVAYYNNNISFRNVINCIIYVGIICALYYCLLYFTKSEKSAEFFDIFYRMTWIYCSLSIVDIIRFGTMSDKLVYYFAGNKFSTCYHFMFLIILFYYKNKDLILKRIINKVQFLLLCLTSILVPIATDCSTAIVGMFFLIILLILPTHLQDLLKKPQFVFIFLVTINALIFASDFLLQSTWWQHIVVDILGESSTMTGRTIIYPYIQTIIRGNPWWGYGYGNLEVLNVVSFGNAQNGLMQTIIDYGVIGTVGFCYLIYANCKKIGNWSFYSLIYTLILCSSVEICFRQLFFTVVLMYGYMPESFNRLEKKSNTEEKYIVGRV